MRHESDETPGNAADATLEGEHGPLARLSKLRGFTVAHGDPDVRGWHVFASDGHRIGEVHDLLVDTQALKVRYLDVEMDVDLLRSLPDARESHRLLAEEGTAESTPHRSITEHLVRESLQPIENALTAELHAGDGVRAHGRHVLIPIGRARLDRDDDRIFVDGLRGEDVLNLPEYGHGPISRAFEADLLQRFDRGYVQSPERDFYSHSLYDQDSFYGPRREERGRAPEEAPREAPSEAAPSSRDRS